MNAFEAKVKIEGLTATLKQATESYYLDNISKMTDQEFDVQLKNLEKLEQEYPPLCST
jgi:NAD-dependent DNA ligase